MRVFNYVFIICGLMILFYLSGLNTSVGYVLNSLNIVEDPGGFAIIQAGVTDVNADGINIYTAIWLILAGVATVGVVIGFFTKSSPESYLIAPLALLLLAFIGDLVWIIIQSKVYCSAGSTCSWIPWVVTFLMAPLAVGYLLSIIDWWRAHD